MEFFISGALMFGSIGIMVGTIIGSSKFQELLNESDYQNQLLKEIIEKLKKKK